MIDFDEMDRAMESPEFKKEFWAWFDDLPQAEKDKFNYYSSNMAELFYYNKFFSKKDKV